MVLVEIRKLLRRPRTWVSLALLVALPTIVAIFLAVSRVGPRPGQGPAFLSAVLTNGALFPAAALAIVLPLFLPVSVAVVAGDAIAGEAAGGTLRYLLVRPVGRTRLLLAKLLTVIVFVLIAVLLVAGSAYVVGTQLFGAHALPTVSGGAALTTSQATLRTTASVLYVGWSMLGVGAIALLLSTFSESALAAALGAIAVLITSGVLQALDAAAAIQPYLPTRYWLAFVDLYRQPALLRNVERGLVLQAAYVAVCLLAAWAHFTTMDVKS